MQIRGDNMSFISSEEIKRMIMRGNPNLYSHVLICLDHFEYSYFPKYVERSEQVKDVIKLVTARGMTSVKEVYSYDLGLDFQLSEFRAYHLDRVEEALKFATRMHEGQYRSNGEPYINHPIRVAQKVEKYKVSKDLDILKMAAYLHDTLEDTSATYEDLAAVFGSAVASIVLELTTDKDMKTEMGKTKYLEIKMKNMSSWALVIKLCDRLDNISDLSICSEEFRRRYTDETIAIIEYVLQNRNLSKTHMNIIKDIVHGLCVQNELANESLEKLKVFEKKYQSFYASYLPA